MLKSAAGNTIMSLNYYLTFVFEVSVQYVTYLIFLDIFYAQILKNIRKFVILSKLNIRRKSE
jgi:hypothetical protein